MSWHVMACQHPCLPAVGLDTENLQFLHITVAWVISKRGRNWPAAFLLKRANAQSCLFQQHPRSAAHGIHWSMLRRVSPCSSPCHADLPGKCPLGASPAKVVPAKTLQVHQKHTWDLGNTSEELLIERMVQCAPYAGSFRKGSQSTEATTSAEAWRTEQPPSIHGQASGLGIPKRLETDLACELHATCAQLSPLVHSAENSTFDALLAPCSF